METNNENADRNEAAAALDAISTAGRAVRDQPWPIWLYLTNALLLGAMPLTALIDSSMVAALVLLALGVSLAWINFRAGQLIGTPYAIPSSKVFLGFVVVAGVCAVASVTLRGSLSDQWIIALAAGTLASYGIGSVVHYRSTHK